MVSTSDDHFLYSLVFYDTDNQKMDTPEGETIISILLKQKLDDYFQKSVPLAHIPLHLDGSAFQKYVFERLKEVSFGKTMSYSEFSCHIGYSKGCRAVASAIAKNPILLIIPCHRIIKKNNDSGNYSGGSDRKRFLLEFES